MLRTENNNKEVLDFINAKLIKDNEKLFKKIPQKVLTEDQELVSDSLTLGTNRNNKVMIGSMLVPGSAFALGLGKVIVGLVAYIPSLSEPHGEEAVQFFERARNFGQETLSSGLSNVEAGLTLLAIPAGVAAISLSKKIHNNLINKRKKELNNNNVVVDLIDDLLEKKENDPTLEFASKFIRKVDISENDSKVNLTIFKYLACHRSMLYLKEQGKVNDNDVQEVYNEMISYFKTIKDSKETSESFKHNRYLNILINELEENNEYSDEISGVVRR